MGETQLDEETFNEYLESLAAMYTAEAYHLIEFNCNNFTADVVGFLTGQETPKWITGELYNHLLSRDDVTRLLSS